jgi:hypothetical protein
MLGKGAPFMLNFSLLGLCGTNNCQLEHHPRLCGELVTPIYPDFVVNAAVAARSIYRLNFTGPVENVKQ